MKKIVCSLMLLLLSVLQIHAITFKENLLFTAKLEGSQVVPAVAGNGVGVASLMLNKTRDSISVNMSFNGLSGLATSVKIYQGQAGNNGAALIDLTPYLTANKLTTKIFGTDVTGNIANLLRSNLYLLVTTNANLSGEIRGQIELEADWNFASDLSGAEAIPAVVTTAYGLGSFNLSMDKTKINYRIICQNLSGAITTAELHFGAIGMTGALSNDLTANVNGNVISGSFVPSAMMLDSLFAGKIYLNIATSANATGELRSQLKHYSGLTFEANADATQMVPPVASPGLGVCIMRLCPTLDTLYYDAVLDNLSSQINDSHAHVGNFGVPYGALQLDFSSSINGNRIKGIVTGTSLNASTIKKLLISNLALAIHTANYPNGELRGQIVRNAREGFTINCTGSQVVAPVATSAYGSGIVSIDKNEDNAHYMWVAGGLSSVTTGAHFNKNIVGQNGPMIYDMTSMTNAQGADASAFGYWKSTDATPFLLTNSKQFQTDSVYLELTNALFPTGELRGQVLKGSVNYAPTAIETLENTNTFDFSVSPIPAQDHLSIRAANLNSETVMIRITDMSGKTVLFNSYPSTGTSLNCDVDVSELNAGVYLITIQNGSVVEVVKLMKQ